MFDEKTEELELNPKSEKTNVIAMPQRRDDSDANSTAKKGPTTPWRPMELLKEMDLEAPWIMRLLLVLGLLVLSMLVL